MKEEDIFARTHLLLGEEVMRSLSEKRVILFGVGGVGSWCAEGLIRSGVKHLTLVDSDRVAISNINRQLPATTLTVGELKVDVMKRNLLAINPYADIETRAEIYSEDSSESFSLSSYDYIIDAIDSLSHKVHLIQTACNTNAVLFSSMGAALKCDITKIRIAEFWKVRGCKLAAALRSRMKKMGRPSKKFLCVYSEELLENKGVDALERANRENSSFKKAQINGTLMHVTASFGLHLSNLVVNDIIAGASAGE